MASAEITHSSVDDNSFVDIRVMPSPVVCAGQRFRRESSRKMIVHRIICISAHLGWDDIDQLFGISGLQNALTYPK